MNRTIIIRREYLHFVPKYSRCTLFRPFGPRGEIGRARPRQTQTLTRLALQISFFARAPAWTTYPRSRSPLLPAPPPRRRADATVAAPPGTLLPCLRPATPPTDEKRHKNVAVHCSPAFRVEVGDQVTVGQCRPLSKTVRFNVLRVSKSKAKTFTRF